MTHRRILRGAQLLLLGILIAVTGGAADSTEVAAGGGASMTGAEIDAIGGGGSARCAAVAADGLADSGARPAKTAIPTTIAARPTTPATAKATALRLGNLRQQIGN